MLRLVMWVYILLQSEKKPHQFKIKLLAPKHPTSLGRERGAQGNSRTH